MLLAGASSKRLSCDRCYAQKLRCSRQTSNNGETCVRCLRRGAECIYSTRLPKGRPRAKPAKTPTTQIETTTPAAPWSLDPPPNPAEALPQPAASPSFSPGSAFPPEQTAFCDGPTRALSPSSSSRGNSTSSAQYDCIWNWGASSSCDICRRRRASCGGETPRCQSCQRNRESCQYNPKTQETWMEQSPIFTAFSHEEAFEITEASLSLSCPNPIAESPPRAGSPPSDESMDITMTESVTPGILMPYWQDREWSDVADAGRPWSAVLLQSVQQPTPTNPGNSLESTDEGDPVPVPTRPRLTASTKKQHSQRPRLQHAGSDDGKENALLSTGYMGSNSSRPRYVESAFWALVHGQESLFDNFLDASHGSPPITDLWDIDAAGTANLLIQTPSRAVCDALLYSFLVCARPLCPLIHLPTFRKAYNTFWRRGRHNDASAPNQMIDNLTFIPLLFSVLYCGAVAAPASFWSGASPLADLHIGNTVDQLRNSYLKGLEHCQYTRYHTMNTLVALLLGHGCSSSDNDASENLSVINMAVRIAQSMGLHREDAQAGIEPITREMRRRVWWYLVSLDTQYSFWYGSQTCCGTEGNQWDVHMVSDASDEAIGESQPTLSPAIPTTNSTTTSMFMLFSIGRYEATRFEHGLLNRANSCHRLSQTDISVYLDEFKTLHDKIKVLIRRMPTQGIPEKGFVPSRLVNASIITHGSLYTEQSDEPSVFISWARITLTMLITSSLLKLQKLFLGHPSLTIEKRGELWLSAFKLSITYIHHLVRIRRIPAFAPYFWFVTRNIFTFQAILIILSYLRQNLHSEDAQIARYFVDEALDIIETSYRRDGSAAQTGEDPPCRDGQGNEPPAIWRLLKTMRMKLDVTTPSYQQTPPTSISAEDELFGFGLESFPPSSESVAGSQSLSELGTGLDISDLDLWSSTVLQGLEDLLSPEDMQQPSRR